MKPVKVLFVFFFAIGLLHIVHALTLDRVIEYREISFNSPRWQVDLDGYLIAFITDIHTMPDEALQAVVDELNAGRIDLALFGGDFSAHGDRYRRSVAILAGIEASDGVFGVQGNHDYQGRLFDAMEYYGIVPLFNNGFHVREGVYVAGVVELWSRDACIDTAVSGAKPDDFVLLLAHNPDISMQQDTSGTDLILSGHTHGGQINFFGIWAPYFTFRNTITEYGQRFASGWASSRDGVPVYVCNGVGVYYNVPRVFARPSVTLLTMGFGYAMQTAVNVPFWGRSFGIAVIFLAVWNIGTFALYGIDKRNARRGIWRISEATLLSCTFLMGGIGALLGMVVFRHKTRHAKFRWLVSFALLVTLGLLVLLIL